MALRFPSFSKGLAQDPTTRRIWFGIATAHDFESHDDTTEERIIPFLFKMIHPQIINMDKGQSFSLFLKSLEFFSYQQLLPTTLDEGSSPTKFYHHCGIFSPSNEVCWASTNATNTSSSYCICPRIRDRLLVYFLHDGKESKTPRTENGHKNYMDFQLMNLTKPFRPKTKRTLKL
jgi:hypothetical protein